ncbi:MAG: tRNA pseudouridine(13) synthase TruD [Deltaproteobacteria bacterium]|nr:tRNA pseudouridine(13) synthase TruD [Deltaproteobacteria bacterium]
MRIKQRPEDFDVSESYRFDPDPRGHYRVYLMDKQKLSTLDAIERLREKFKLKRDAFSICGLKDKQGRTKQLIAVEDADIQMQAPDLRLKFLGRTAAPLSAENITSNRFSVTVRDLTPEDLDELPGSVAEVNRVGVVNYFDSQRFGHLKHGQGLIARELIRGRFERALQGHFGTPSELDHTDDGKVKKFWAEHWGQWTARPPWKDAAQRYRPIVQHLEENPTDFAGAFMKIDARMRTMILYTYQSFLWNEGVRRLLMGLVPREMLVAIPYQAGTVLFPRDLPPEVQRRLRKMSFPLLGPDTVIRDPDIKSAVDWVLGREHLTIPELKIPGLPQIFFKHEERQLLIYPGKLIIGKPADDEHNEKKTRVNVAFTLPPGAYATLVVKRLFWFDLEKGRKERLDAEREAKTRAVREASIAERKANPPPGFRAQQAEKKRLKKERQQAAKRPGKR